ncbi:MAG: FecR domain-containing protein [Spirochaetota bacterium]
MKKSLTAAAAAALLSLSCGGAALISGKATFVAGDASIMRAGKVTPLTLGSAVHERDSVITGTNGVAVIAFADVITVEIQHNASFDVRSIRNAKKNFYLSRGNVWAMVKKLAVDNELSIETPNSIASVRGTKFYTFDVGAIHGTCHCEGVIDYRSGNFSGTNDSDYLVFTKDGVSIVVNPSELAFVGMTGHDHSILPDSPVGYCPPKGTTLNMKKMTEYLEARLAEAKKTGKPR